MAKKRVHELARELNIESKELVNKALAMGISVKSHMSTLDTAEVEKITNTIRGKETAGKQQNEAAHTKQKQEKNKQGEKRKSQNQNQGRSPEKDDAPGLVNKVPSRPPDRRFSEKPSRGKQQQPRKQQRPQPKSEQQEKGHREKGHQDRGRQDKGHQDKGRQERGRQDKGQQEKSKTEAKQGRPAPAETKTSAVKADNRRGNKPKGKGKPVDKVKAAEKAKPDEAKAMEKARAQERAKQVEKQAYRESQRQKDKQEKKKFDEGKMPTHPSRKKTRSSKQNKKAAREKKTITIPQAITIKELSEQTGISSSEIIKKLMSMGVMATINQEIDADTAVLVGEELNVEIKVKEETDEEAELIQDYEDDPSELQPRPCVVTVIGHVDHGKTSLLDAIRETKVTASESGGITQHIGAYQVERNNKKITFLDTPGHEAFTAMRARGTQVTDVAILVIGADDGVMPQTVEAINHAKAAGVPIIVAINKIDKTNADPDKVKRELTEHELVPEEWGGDTICVPVSATLHEGLDELLEMILLVSEMQELKANPNRLARGTVIEAQLDKGRGPVATVLVQKGTLQVGDAIVAGTAHGRVRAMMDYTGQKIEKAGPAFPVQVLGFSEVPEAGEQFLCLEDEKKARELSEKRQNRKREEEMRASMPKVSLDDFFNQIQEGQVKELAIIIKADVQGSVEALKQSLEKLSTGEVKVNIIHEGVGAISWTDIMLASASNAIVIGFNVRPDANARKTAETEKVDIRTYRVIYEAIEDVKSAMTGLLDPEYKEVVLGRAEVRQTFKVSKVGTIAGCYVTEGKIVRDAGARLLRDGVVIYEGKIDSLKRFKDDAKEVVENYECGLTLEKFNDINEGDIVEAFTTEAVQRELV